MSIIDVLFGWFDCWTRSKYKKDKLIEQYEFNYYHIRDADGFYWRINSDSLYGLKENDI